MNLKVRCCCEAPNVEVQFIEVEPVIPLPSDAQLVGDVTWWLDLGEVVELNPSTEIYEGGQASTFGVPIVYGSDFVFVPSKADPQVWWEDGDITGQTNLAQIFSLRHRGWKKKEPPRQASFEQLAEIGGTRIVWQKPSGVSDDQIDQLEGDGIFFAASQLFNQNPALVTSRTSTDYGGDTIGYTVGYNPRKECVKPEQGRYYGTASHPKLLFDFTAQFPDSITLQFKFPALDRFDNDVTLSRTFNKFVLGAETVPTTSPIDIQLRPAPFPPVPVDLVDGFDDQDPENAESIKFGYRSGSDNYLQYAYSALTDAIVQLPSIPFFWISHGSSSVFGGVKVGEGSENMPAVVDGFAANFQKATAGDVLQDITYHPLGEEESDYSTRPIPAIIPSQGTIPSQQPKRLFASSVAFPFENVGGFPISYTCGSYKGAVAIQSNYTTCLHTGIPSGPFSTERGPLLPETPYEFFLTTQYATNNDGASDPVSVPTMLLPAFAWDEEVNLRLEEMTNPILGVNHPLTGPAYTAIITPFSGAFPPAPTGSTIFNTPQVTLV